MAAKLYCGWQKDSQLLNSQSTILLPLPLFVPVSPLLRYSYKKMGGTLPHAACLPARQDVWALPERFLPNFSVLSVPSVASALSLFQLFARNF